MTAKHPEMMVGAGTVLTVEQVDEAVAAVGTLAKIGVDCSHIVRGGDRLGIYFLENGASVRPSSVIYDRANSAIKQQFLEISIKLQKMRYYPSWEAVASKDNFFSQQTFTDLFVT